MTTISSQIPFDLIRKLDALSFQSLQLAGIDWRQKLKDSPELKEEYIQFLRKKANYVIVQNDYSQLELYVLASISGDKNMIATVNSGKDIHSENTKKIYGIDYELLERQETKYRETFGESHDEYKAIVKALAEFKNKRKATKALSFSLSYGAGKEKISMDLRISVEEAQKLIDDFYSIYPQVRTWQNETFKSAIENGFLETPFGRRRATPKIHKRYDAYKALVDEDKKAISQLKRQGEYWSLREEFKTCKNTPIQSVASDMCSWAAYKVNKMITEKGYDATFLFWVHDAIVSSCHLDDSLDYIKDTLHIMENEVKYLGDVVNYRAALDLGYSYEFLHEVSRDMWLPQNLTEEQLRERQKEVLFTALTKAVDEDIEKKFKLIVKSSTLELNDNYVESISKTKKEYFEKLVEGLGIPGIHTPKDYMLYMNRISEEEMDAIDSMPDLEDSYE